MAGPKVSIIKRFHCIQEARSRQLTVTGWTTLGSRGLVPSSLLLSALQTGYGSDSGCLGWLCWRAVWSCREACMCMRWRLEMRLICMCNFQSQMRC